MEVIWDILSWILWIYLFLIFARIIIGWLPVSWPKGLRRIVVLIYDVTEPVLSPLRRILPIIPVSGGVGIDLSPIVVVMIIFFLQWLIGRISG